MMAGRVKRPLGDAFGLTNFGVNLTTLPPGAVSALHHTHSRQDEFIYVLDGRPTLYLDDETLTLTLTPGAVFGFPAGGPAHHLRNETDTDCTIFEIGDRRPGDELDYPADDLQAITTPDGERRFARKNGAPY